MRVDVTLKKFFYDRERVKAKLDRKRLASLRKVGGQIRLRARRKLRRRNRVSRPGEAPSVHTASAFATLKNIQFGFDTDQETAVVGPIGLGSHGGDGPAPGTLEHGGGGSHANTRRTERVVGGSGEIDVDGKARKDQRRGASGRYLLKGERAETATKDVVDYRGKRRRVTYGKLHTPAQAARANKFNAELYGPDSFTSHVEARPFMGPAVADVKDEMVDLYLKEG